MTALSPRRTFSGTALKTIACITMLVDHIGASCIEAGIDIPTVAKWLGHRDGGALAMKVYGHLRDEHSKEAAKKLAF